VLAMTPKGAYFANIAAIIAAMAVSFVVSAVLLKTSKVKKKTISKPQRVVCMT
jgi:PTS system mannitol-specific IIC component